MRAMLCLALLWGWTHFASSTALGFEGLLHPCEFLQNRREALVLPSDVLHSCADAFLHIQDPKTRRFARHQHSRIADPSVVELLECTYGHAPGESYLWPYSSYVYRRCWNDILSFLGVPSMTAQGGPTPGSLRGSGATDLYLQRMAIPDIAWQGRWLRVQTLEFYLQEVAARTLLPRLPADARDRIMLLSDAAASVVSSYLEAGSPGSWTERIRTLHMKPPPRRAARLQADRLHRRKPVPP